MRKFFIYLHVNDFYQIFFEKNKYFFSLSRKKLKETQLKAQNRVLLG
jgi:hypothetical protein